MSKTICNKGEVSLGWYYNVENGQNNKNVLDYKMRLNLNSQYN
ncbi:hypothetical protein [Ancylomarina sp. 16SWW S1-10-2]|nr:hypothetical protein [Ancylomarina sp. 16SWW S1-10-2]